MEAKPLGRGQNALECEEMAGGPPGPKAGNRSPGHWAGSECLRMRRIGWGPTWRKGWQQEPRTLGRARMLYNARNWLGVHLAQRPATGALDTGQGENALEWEQLAGGPKAGNKGPVPWAPVAGLAF